MADENMFTMQQEALRRAREMYSRAVPPPYTRPPEEEENRNTSNINREEHRNENQNPSPQGGLGNLGNNFMDLLFKDKDRTIILALLILLSGEDGDNTLLYALMYLLM